jgi:hypothetical protein
LPSAISPYFSLPLSYCLSCSFSFWSPRSSVRVF